jgi:hypothetical protein
MFKSALFAFAGDKGNARAKPLRRKWLSFQRQLKAVVCRVKSVERRFDSFHRAHLSRAAQMNHLILRDILCPEYPGWVVLKAT